MTMIDKELGLYLLPNSCGKVDHFFAAFQQAVNQIPISDRRSLLRYFRSIRADLPTRSAERKYTPVILLNYDLVSGSSAVVMREGAEMLFEATVMDNCDQRRVAAIIGHELGHVRSYAEGGDSSENEADAFAKKWGFPQVECVYKTEKSLKLEAFARKKGLKGQVFLLDFLEGDSFFVYLPPNELLTCDPIDPTWYLDDEFDEAKNHLKVIWKMLKQGEGLAWEE